MTSPKRPVAALLAALLLPVPAVRAQAEMLPLAGLTPAVDTREDLLLSASVRKAVEPVLRRSLVKIETEKGSLLGLATVVEADGFLAAKAGDLAGVSNLVARTFTGRTAIARRVGYDPANDLLLLKANLAGLRVPAAAAGEPEIGTFAFAADGERTLRLRGGLISATPRPIAKMEGVLGIVLGRSLPDTGITVAEVAPESGAAEAGLRRGDIVTAIQGTPVDSREKLQELVFKHDPGEVLSVKFRRGESELEKEVRLGHRSVVFNLFGRNQLMSGETSKRKTGFTRVLQNELTLNHRSMGGLLLDADGRALGLNIARVNRVENYTLPWSLVLSSCRKLRADASSSDTP